MTHAVLLSAGQGRRLSPLTDSKPKCLVSVAGATILDWQLRALGACGIRDVTIVTGFGSEAVEASLKVGGYDLNTSVLFNPFYKVADNIGSCWMARDLIRSDCLLINGDTLFDPRVLAKVLETAKSPISVTIDRKAAYDSDDMKVKLDAGRLARIGKTLTGRIDGESIGLLQFRNGGGAAFVDRMENLLRDQASLGLWYLSVIDQLAGDAGAPEVGTVSIEGLPWAEIDFPHDLPVASDRVAGFDWHAAPSTDRDAPVVHSAAS
ncbi:MAG: phosphocholine cytidylyltransferase family protein [Pseudomonadota bacterium]